LQNYFALFVKKKTVTDYAYHLSFSLHSGNKANQKKIDEMQLLAARTILNYLKAIIVWEKFPHGIIKLVSEKKSGLYLSFGCVNT